MFHITCISLYIIISLNLSLILSLNLSLICKKKMQSCHKLKKQLYCHFYFLRSDIIDEKSILCVVDRTKETVYVYETCLVSVKS